MSGPQELNISFQHLGTDYNINLVKGAKSEHSVDINGISYAVLGEQEKLVRLVNFKSVSLESISNSKI